MHGYHVFDEHAEQGSLNIVAGDGAYIYDTQGNRFLDAVGGMWCTNIGLGREEMALAIADQVRQLAYSNPFSDMANNVAIELCENSPAWPRATSTMCSSPPAAPRRWTPPTG
jgi:adenosylmethionine-8-amino-7-oxononanoate aminotransferase